MKTKQTIEVPGLPEGWKAVEYRCAIKGEFVLIGNQAIQATHDHTEDSLIVEKIQPRRIVLEETAKYHEPESNYETHTQIFVIDKVSVAKVISNRIWREVKETDIPLTADEPKLSDCMKWAEDLILQLDEHHQGRNSWLCHYGRSKQAEEARRESLFEFVEVSGRFNISKRKDK